MEARQVDEAFLAAHRPPVLAAGEDEQPVHRAPLFAFAVPLARFWEAEGVVVLYRQLGLRAQGGRPRPVGLGLSGQRFCSSACRSGARVRALARRTCTSCAGRIRAPERPCRVSGCADCAPSRFFQTAVGVLAHVPRVLWRKAVHAWTGRARVDGQPFDRALVPAFAPLALHDQPPDVPAQAGRFLVERAPRRVPRGLDARLRLGLPDSMAATFCG